MTSRRRLVGTVAATALVLAGCSTGGGGPDKELVAAVQKLAKAIPTGDASAVAFTVPSAGASFATLWAPLKKYDTSVEVGKIAESGGTAKARLTLTTDFGGATWRHATVVSLARKGSTWKVVWKPSIAESSLQNQEKLVVTGIKAERGKILGAGGKPIVEPRPVVRFGIDKTLVSGSAVTAAANRLAALLDLAPAPFLTSVAKAGPKAFVEALVLRRSDVSSNLLGRIAAIKGARSISDHRPLAPTKDFAAAIIGTVGPATAELIKKSAGRLHVGDDAGLSGLQARYDEQLGGVPGIKVSAEHVVEEASDTAAAAAPRVLFSQDAVAGKPLTLSLDLALQKTAQRLLTRYQPASALVAIRPSTGEIVAVASGPGSKGLNTATFGQYAPGSTFKMVSSLALLRAGVKPTTIVPCPPNVTVNGKRFKNYSDYPSGRLGRIPLRQAVANSCNTAFISERGKIRGTALADAAAALGFGVDHDTGFPTYFGSVPAPSGETEAAADLIGQGKVLASPLAMATVLASVVKGGTVLPVLIPALKPAASTPAHPLTKAEAVSLRALLRAVVTEGSGIALQSLGSPPVIAKTGTAEYGEKAPLRTHAWMVGAQGDLAVAVFVADGQSGSGTAGPVLKAFLAAAKH